MSGQVRRGTGWGLIQSWVTSLLFSHSNFFFFFYISITRDGASRIKYHLCDLFRFEARDNHLAAEQPALADEKGDLKECQKCVRKINVMKLYFPKVSWGYEKNIKNHSASQFSLLIYNHLSHAYIQYIKIYKTKRNKQKNREHTYYCQVKLRHLRETSVLLFECWQTVSTDCAKSWSKFTLKKNKLSLHLFPK